MALFPKGSATHEFFQKCTHNTLEEEASWFCDTTATIALIERPKPRSHEDEIQAFIARHSVRLGAYKGKQEGKLTGMLEGMELSGLGFELPQEDPKRPETKGLAPFPWVVFLATETMPDGTGLVLSCTLAGSEAMKIPPVQMCHAGMKHLRDRMLDLHKK